MPGDLVSGRWPVTYPFAKALGFPANASQSNLTVRSNAEYLSLAAAADTAAALVSGVGTAVAVPVEIGDVITRITVRTGATAAVTPTQSWAALYTGTSGGVTPALIAQSVSGGTAAIAAVTSFAFTLATPVTVTATNAPNGYLYVSVSVTGTTVPSLAAVPSGAAALWANSTTPWFTGAPIPAQTHGTALGATAPATITGGTVVANSPLVFLS